MYVNGDIYRYINNKKTTRLKSPVANLFYI